MQLKSTGVKSLMFVLAMYINYILKLPILFALTEKKMQKRQVLLLIGFYKFLTTTYDGFFPNFYYFLTIWWPLI